MGKRSTNTTKSGKFMNPTDRARKEARKKELKKNKKQRLQVRAAVLKGKNPREIVVELEKLDDMGKLDEFLKFLTTATDCLLFLPTEFNVMAPPPLNDKVLRDKRRKLHETWQRWVSCHFVQLFWFSNASKEFAMHLSRVMIMYEKEDVEQYVELKKIWHNYQNRKTEIVKVRQSNCFCPKLRDSRISQSSLPWLNPAVVRN
jgi:WW domain-binding protein 11